jgi:hypothetical protein
MTMPSNKSSKTTDLAGAARKKSGRKPPRNHKPPHKPHKPPDDDPDVDPIIAEPPIVVTSGSVEIDLDSTIFPVDPGNPNKHKNSNRKLTTVEIQDLATPPRTLLKVDVKSLSGGRCKIIIGYEK